MSNEAFSIKINVSKIDKNYLFKGESGTYLDCAVWPNKDGVGKFGDTHYITQSVSKEAKAQGVKGPIIGNARPIQQRGGAPKPKPAPAKQDEDQQIPF